MGLMTRFEVTPGRHKPKLMLTGTICLLAFFGALFFAVSGGSIPFLPKGGEVVEAEFRTAANVTPGKTPVRVKGVNVGEVEEVERLDGGRGVRIKMRIDDDGVKLKKDARADIYWRTLLGFGFYIQLEPGSEQASLGGDRIPMDRTSAQVEADEVLAGLTPPSREGMQQIFAEFDKGFGDGPSGQALDALAPAMRQAAPGLDALRGQKDGDLTQTVKEASRFMGALAKDEVQLGQVVSNANTTLGVTAAKRADLGSILSNGPSTLDQTTSTMTRLRTTLDELDPIAQELRPGVRKITPASRAARPALVQLRPLLADARPLLKSLQPTLRRLGSASRSGVPLMKNLAPTLDRLEKQIIPALEEESPSTKLKAYEAIGPTISAVSSSSSLFDANGFTQRFNPGVGEKSVLAIPCTPDIAKLKLDCSDLESMLGEIFLGGPVRSKAVSLRSTPGSSSASGSTSSAGSTTKSSSSSAGAAGDEARVLDQVVEIVRGVL